MTRRLALEIPFLMLLVLLALAPSCAGCAGGAVSAGNPMAPETWMEHYRLLAQQAPPDCPELRLPDLPPDAPIRAFPLDALAGSVAQGPRVVLVQDPIVERVIFLALGADGCVRAGASGRLLPFADRSRPSPYPNLILPAALGDAPPVVIIADRKSIRPWIDVIHEPELDLRTAEFWMGLGASPFKVPTN